MNPLYTRLRNEPLFADLTDGEIGWLAEQASLCQLSPGEYLFHAGEEPKAAYLVLSGELESWEIDPRSGEERLRARVWPGELVGGTAVLAEKPYKVSVRVTKPAEVVCIPADVFKQLVQAYPSLQEKFSFDTAEHAAFFFNVEGLDLQPDEHVLIVKRRHWMALVGSLTWPVGLMVLVTLLVAVLLGRRMVSEEWNSFILLGWGVSLVPLVIWTVWRVIDYLNDFYIVTTHRVIHIEEVLFFRKERHEAPIEKVQDVQIRINNPIERILNYGEVIISTAGKAQIFFRHVPQPEYIQRAIVAQKLRFESRVHVQAQSKKRQVLRQTLGLEPRAPSQSEAQPELEEHHVQKESRLSRLGRYFNPFVLREESSEGILWRKHWIVLIWKIVPVIAFLFLLVIGAGLALFYVQSRTSSSWFTLLIILLYGILFIVGVGWLLWEYEDWRNDVYILTKVSVIDEEKRPLGLEKEVRQAPLEMIQDVRFRIPTPLHTLLNVGDVIIETAGAQGQFTFDAVKDPQSVVQEIYRRLHAYEEERLAREQARIDNSVLEMIALYHREFHPSSSEPWLSGRLSRPVKGGETGRRPDGSPEDQEGGETEG